MSVSKTLRNGKTKDWRAVADEMLAGRDLGAQVSREEAWRRACKEIERLRKVAADMADWVQPSQDDLGPDTLKWIQENER